MTQQAERGPINDPSEYYAGGSKIDAAPTITARRIGQLILKTWPFLRPLIKHLAALLGITLPLLIVLFGAWFLGGDIFNNKVLVGDRLQPMQASALLLDESYVTTGAENEPKRKLT